MFPMIQKGTGKKHKKKKLKSTNLSDGVEVGAEANEESGVGDEAKTGEKLEKGKREKLKSKDEAEAAKEIGKSKKKKKTDTESVFYGVCDKAKTSKNSEKSEKKKSKSKDETDGVDVEAEASKESGKSKKKNKTDTESVSDGVGDEAEEVEKGKKKEKKKKSGDISSAGEEDKGKKKEKKAKSGKAEKRTENPPERSSKRLSFADDLEISGEVPYKEARKLKYKGIREGMVVGKRFSPEEDEMIGDAVSKYIEKHNLGEKGIDMIINCIAHKEVKDCWKEIVKCIPHRPPKNVYCRGRIILLSSKVRNWTAEEKEYVQEFYKKHGADWKTLATELNKDRYNVKEAWRRNRLKNPNKGRWSQKEYQSLFDLVNKDLSIRALEERKSKYGLIRDNIAWDAISDTMATRDQSTYCKKWYMRLSSPLVAQGLWSDTDDYRLVNALLELDAPNTDEVEWDNLIEHRDGDITLKRWNQMVKHIGEYSKLSFSQQVEVLGQRYSPEFIPAREEFDSKPFVDC